MTELVGCFTLIVFLMACHCYCYVALSRGAVGWSAMFDHHLLFVSFIVLQSYLWQSELIALL